MKRIYMTLALAAAFGVTSFAQKTADLSAVVLAPDGSSANLGATDTIRFAFIVSNAGPDAVTPDDTLKVWLDTRILGSQVYGIQKEVMLGCPPMDLAAGASDTLHWSVPNGSTFWSGQANSVAVPSDAKVCTKLVIFGYDNSMHYFVDDGFDATTYNAAQTADDIWAAFSGNNLSTTTVTYGTGEEDLCVPVGIKALKEGHVAINIYPNPVVSNTVHFNFMLDQTADNATIRVTDVTGRTVLTQEMGRVSAGQHNLDINISALNSGLYFLQLNAGGKQGVAKFTVSK